MLINKITRTLIVGSDVSALAFTLSSAILLFAKISQLRRLHAAAPILGMLHIS
jgi:hypothetical protein